MQRSRFTSHLWSLLNENNKWFENRLGKSVERIVTDKGYRTNGRTSWQGELQGWHFTILFNGHLQTLSTSQYNTPDTKDDVMPFIPWPREEI